MKYKYMKDEELVKSLETLASLERTTLADLIECLKEIDMRRLYLSLGFSSLFSYLTEGLGYSPGSAQRRIDAARMAKVIPGLKDDLSEGSLNLMQVSLIAQGLRQKEKLGQPYDAAAKINLVEKVKFLDVDATQKILAKELDLEAKVQEKLKPQKDDSVRMEITFTKEQMEKIERARELLSHTRPDANWAELITAFAETVIKQKDPRVEKPKYTAKMEVKFPTATKRLVHQREHACQWTNKITGRKCNTRFQLQIDHVRPVWANGDNSASNLQILCSAHNRMKYKKETLTRSL